MSPDPCILTKFLMATEGNWRNAIFISCREVACPYGHKCSGYLFASDADGKPVLLPVEVFQRLTGEQLDPSEAHGMIERKAFEQAFQKLMLWSTSSDCDCGLHQLTNECLPLPCSRCGDRLPPQIK